MSGGRRDALDSFHTTAKRLTSQLQSCNCKHERWICLVRGLNELTVVIRPTANRVLSMIRQSFSYLSKDMALYLYKTLVRPHLEYCMQAWRPYLKKDIELMEGVQRRVTKLVLSMRKYSYEERLKFFNLTTLETRRCRGDLIEVFKRLLNYRSYAQEDTDWE
jgi:hypothetical protein